MFDRHRTVLVRHDSLEDELEYQTSYAQHARRRNEQSKSTTRTNATARSKQHKAQQVHLQQLHYLHIRITSRRWIGQILPKEIIRWDDVCRDNNLRRKQLFNHPWSLLDPSTHRCHALHNFLGQEWWQQHSWQEHVHFSDPYRASNLADCLIHREKQAAHGLLQS